MKEKNEYLHDGEIIDHIFIISYIFQNFYNEFTLL